jgi:hypothetical protein
MPPHVKAATVVGKEKKEERKRKKKKKQNKTKEQERRTLRWYNRKEQKYEIYTCK